MHILGLFMLFALHSFAAALHFLRQNIPLIVIGSAGSVFMLIQILKRYLRNVNGWVPIALNFFANLSIFFAVLPAADFWTMHTAEAIIAAWAAAAGIHGTAVAIGTNGLSSTGNMTPSGPMMRR